MKKGLLLLLLAPLLQAAELASGISEERIEAILRELPEEARAAWLDEQKLRSLIEQLALNRIAAEEAKGLGALKDPLLQAQLQNETEKLLARWRVAKLKEEVSKRDLTEAARDYYEAHKEQFRSLPKLEIYEIQIDPARWGKEKAKERLKEVIERLKKGEEFSRLAREFSDDPYAKEGGYVGWVDKRHLRIPALWPDLERMELGEWRWFETDLGYHIVKVTGKRPSRQLSFEEAKPLVLKRVREELAEKAVKAYLEELRQNHPVKIDKKALQDFIARQKKGL